MTVTHSPEYLAKVLWMRWLWSHGGRHIDRRRAWLLKDQLWKQIASWRRATATMALADETRHEIYVVVPDWGDWPVAPWYTSKLQTWQLMDRRQRRRLLRRVFKHEPQKLRRLLQRAF